jgi:hypothetical protein
MSRFEDEVARCSAAIFRRECAKIEEWCERSLTDPEGRGVLILRRSQGVFDIGLSSLVPWAEIYEVETRA